ncbi:hypothetical protein Btru_052306 [Bulinus truncatus]|nr:hypothetical protein Btru_052306 [Bulinus truncatus]
MESSTDLNEEETVRKSSKRVSALISQFNNFQQNPALPKKSNSFRIPSKIQKVDTGQKDVTRSQSMSHRITSSEFCDTRDGQVKSQTISDQTDRVEIRVNVSCKPPVSGATPKERVPPLERVSHVESPSTLFADAPFSINAQKEIEMVSNPITNLCRQMEISSDNSVLTSCTVTPINSQVLKSRTVTSADSSVLKSRTVTAWSKLRGTLEKSNTAGLKVENKTDQRLLQHDQTGSSVKQATDHRWRRQQFAELAKQASMDNGSVSTFNSTKVTSDSVTGSQVLEHSQVPTINIKQIVQNFSLGRSDWPPAGGVSNSNNHDFNPSQNVSTTSSNQIQQVQPSQQVAKLDSWKKNGFRSLKIKNISFGDKNLAHKDDLIQIKQSDPDVKVMSTNSLPSNKSSAADSVVHTQNKTEDYMAHHKTMTSDFITGHQTKTSNLACRAIKLPTLCSDNRPIQSSFANDIQKKPSNSTVDSHTIQSDFGQTKQQNCNNPRQVKPPEGTYSTNRSMDEMTSQTHKGSEKTIDAVVAHNEEICTSHNVNEAERTTEQQSEFMRVGTAEQQSEFMRLGTTGQQSEFMRVCTTEQQAEFMRLGTTEQQSDDVFISNSTTCFVQEHISRDHHLSPDKFEYIQESTNELKLQHEPREAITTGCNTKCDQPFQFDVEGVHSTKMEYCLATDRINSSLVKLKSELMSMHEQDLILLKQLINISQTIQKLQRSRVLRMSKSLSFSNGLLHPQPLHLEKRSYSSSLVRQNSAPFNMEKRRQLFSLMRTSTEQWSDGSVSSFDESELDSQSEMEESAPSLTSIYPYLSPKSMRARPMFQYKSSQRSLCVDVAEDPDQTYEDILKRNVRLWKMNLKNQQSVIEEVTRLL